MFYRWERLGKSFTWWPALSSGTFCNDRNVLQFHCHQSQWLFHKIYLVLGDSHISRISAALELALETGWDFIGPLQPNLVYVKLAPLLFGHIFRKLAISEILLKETRFRPKGLFPPRMYLALTKYSVNAHWHVSAWTTLEPQTKTKGFYSKNAKYKKKIRSLLFPCTVFHSDKTSRLHAAQNTAPERIRKAHHPELLFIYLSYIHKPATPLPHHPWNPYPLG